MTRTVYFRCDGPVVDSDREGVTRPVPLRACSAEVDTGAATTHHAEHVARLAAWQPGVYIGPSGHRHLVDLCPEHARADAR